MALQALYQCDLGGAEAAEALASFRPAEYGSADGEASTGSANAAGVRKAFSYARKLTAGTREHREEVDGLIRQQAEHWRLERMPAVDRNILRLAVYELLHEPDVPQLVVLDEAIELAKKFGSEDSKRFVNGVLDGLLKRHRFPGTRT